MNSVFREDSMQDSSSGCESDTEENLLSEGFPGSNLHEEERLKAVQRLPRQKGHYKLKVRHQVEHGPGKRCYHVTQLQESDSSSSEKPTNHSALLACIKETLALEEEPKDQSETSILETSCLSSLQGGNEENTEDRLMTSPLSTEEDNDDDADDESEVIVDIHHL